MTQCAVTGAMLKCSFGLAPSTLNVLPTPRVLVEGRPAGDISSTIAGVNIPPFGMCTTLSNPTVAAATAAALGTLTPMPCMPVIPAPWIPQVPTVLIGGKPVLTFGSTCVCAYGGVIQMITPGTAQTMAG